MILGPQKSVQKNYKEFDMDEAAVHTMVKITDDFQLSHHTWQRIGTRGALCSTIKKVLTYCLVVHTRGAMIYVIGRKEIKRYMDQGVDLADLHGMQVICSKNDTILTSSRNRDHRLLRPRYCSHCRSSNQ